ncbi:MAG: hypothetical protein NFCOHLIN_01163 [Gammaproteobacteria bacterium]|nr:hypothetical protein [Gammaproteobacteria bacterium]
MSRATRRGRSARFIMRPDDIPATLPACGPARGACRRRRVASEHGPVRCAVEALFVEASHPAQPGDEHSARTGLHAAGAAHRALHALPRREGQGRDRADHVRRLLLHLAGLPGLLRPARLHGRLRHPGIPGLRRARARARRGADDPAHAHGPAHALGRGRLVAAGLPGLPPRAGASLLAEGDGRARHPARQARLRRGRPPLQGRWARWSRTVRRARASHRSVLVAFGQQPTRPVRRVAGEPHAVRPGGLRGGAQDRRR